MDRGILDVESVQKNIELIDYYSREEALVLDKIYNSFNNCNNNYQSEDKKIKLDNTLLQNNIRLIKEKRFKYTITLREAINRYQMLSQETEKFFENGG